jgi:hypothetical protein
MAKDDKSPRVKITNQFHDNHGMVYDLKCDTTRITISLGAASKDEGTEWNIEAMVKQVPEPHVVRAVGSSKSDALRAISETWRSHGEAAGFPLLDWAAIRECLTAVRAI